MTATGGAKVYDLEERTFLFAQRVRRFVKTVPRSIANVEDIKQVVRASGSVGANYIAANDAVGPKDRVYRVRIARKEAKESRFWLRLIEVGPDPAAEEERAALIREAVELMSILAAIMRKIEAAGC